jgi:hypothetical protein
MKIAAGDPSPTREGGAHYSNLRARVLLALLFCSLRLFRQPARIASIVYPTLAGGARIACGDSPPEKSKATDRNCMTKSIAGLG